MENKSKLFVRLAKRDFRNLHNNNTRGWFHLPISSMTLWQKFSNRIASKFVTRIIKHHSPYKAVNFFKQKSRGKMLMTLPDNFINPLEQETKAVQVQSWAQNMLIYFISRIVPNFVGAKKLEVLPNFYTVCSTKCAIKISIYLLAQYLLVKCWSKFILWETMVIEERISVIKKQWKE